MPEVEFIAYDAQQVEQDPEDFHIPAVGEGTAEFWSGNRALWCADAHTLEKAVQEVAYRKMMQRIQETHKLNACAFFKVGILEVADGVVTNSYAVSRYVASETFVRISTNEFEPQDGDWICDGVEPYYLAGKIGREIKVDYDY